MLCNKYIKKSKKWMAKFRNFREFLNEDEIPHDDIKVIIEDVKKWLSSSGLTNRSYADADSAWAKHKAHASISVSFGGITPYHSDGLSISLKGENVTKHSLGKYSTNYEWTMSYPESGTKTTTLDSYKLVIETMLGFHEKYKLIGRMIKVLGEETYNQLRTRDFLKFYFSGVSTYTKTGEVSSFTPVLRLSNRGNVTFSSTDGGCSVTYPVKDGENIKEKRVEVNPEHGELLYYSALAANLDGAINEDFIEVLNALSDQPIEKVIEVIEKNSLEQLKAKYIGAVAGKQYGI
jgi:hypothetical protein